MSNAHAKIPSTRVMLPAVAGGVGVRAGSSVRHSESAYAHASRNGHYDEHKHHHKKHSNGGGASWAAAVIFFIVLVILIWIILWALCPEFCAQKDGYGSCTDKLSCGKILFWAIIIALIITIIVGAIYAAVGGNYF